MVPTRPRPSGHVAAFSVRWCLTAVCGTALLATTEARADDLFEIQVFHARANEPGQFGAELHSNYVAKGVTTREAPELSPHHVLYEMLEPTLGLATGWEAGMHIQTALRPGHAVDFGGLKARSLVLLPSPEGSDFHFAINFEGGYTPVAYDPGQWVFEIRPVIEWRLGYFDLDLNPIVSFKGVGEKSGVPRLDPAIAARYSLFETLDVGVEYYASFGPVGSFASLSGQTHYVFETIDLTRWPGFILRAGVGEGLTAASNPITITTMLGHFF